MKRFRILDCTLRDGGYCNQWKFGYESTKKIINGLFEANVEIVECGFLTNKEKYINGITKFNSMTEVASVLPQSHSEKMYVGFINYGEYTLDELPLYDGTSLDGIRLGFHKKDLREALKFCAGIKEKGYKVFVQPMVTLNYTDEEFIDLIKRSNAIDPYAFYIVDSFGVMKPKDLTRFFYMLEHNLKEEIYIGYHSHNNMQLAYSNSQMLTTIQTKRHIIIDSSIFGMGRGAGNLNTELFVEYLNDTEGTEYKLQPLLTIIDQILNKFYQENYWGYSLPNYLSASHNIHPDYAGYLSDKQTLTVENIDAIFSMMSEDKKVNYDKEYMETLYLKYMATGKINDNSLLDLKNRLKNKRVLIIAPGHSSVDEKEKIISCAMQKDVLSIAINFNYTYVDTDLIFLSNLRRYRELDKSMRNKCIVTSNIPAEDVYLRVRYTKLINSIEAVKDNAGMMLIRFLIDIGVDSILLAGMDGYSHESSENYADEEMTMITNNVVLDARNAGINKIISDFSKNINIVFLTNPRYIVI